jgi:hypothetical protein
MMTATRPVNVGQVDTGDGGGSFGTDASLDPVGRSADDGGATPGGAGRRASLVEQGYVRARFDGLPVLVGPEFAAQLRAIRQSPERGSR